MTSSSEEFNRQAQLYREYSRLQNSVTTPKKKKTDNNKKASNPSPSKAKEMATQKPK